MVFLRWAACLAALLAVAVAPGSAGAATTINFETPALAAGTTVTTQFSGVVFYAGGTPGANQLPVSDTTRRAREIEHACARHHAGRVDEFPQPGVSGTFAATAQTVTTGQSHRPRP